MANSAPILALEWDKDGEYLAILQEGNGVVPLWNLSSKRVTHFTLNKNSGPSTSNNDDNMVSANLNGKSLL
eukprot:gene22349-28469_t